MGQIAWWNDGLAGPCMVVFGAAWCCCWCLNGSSVLHVYPVFSLFVVCVFSGGVTRFPQGSPLCVWILCSGGVLGYSPPPHLTLCFYSFEAFFSTWYALKAFEAFYIWTCFRWEVFEALKALVKRLRLWGLRLYTRMEVPLRCPRLRKEKVKKLLIIFQCCCTWWNI